jgi:hypothetical protein
MGLTSPKQDLLQAGLPQRSPLSPILFLFFNADLVQQRIDTKGGSFAFVDDYNAWVTGPSAEANQARVQEIIGRAEQWEKRSGATFEASKTAIIHFTRTASRVDNGSFWIKGEEIAPKQETKILGVIVDRELRIKSHLSKGSYKRLKAASALKRLKMLSPRTARQLFMSKVAPVMDYASNIWKFSCTAPALRAMNQAQRIRAQAVTGVFRSVAVEMAEAEADIPPINQRLGERAAKLWVELRTLPETNPLQQLHTKAFRRFVSLLQRIFQGHQVQVKVETIHAYPVPPWETRVEVLIKDYEEAVETVRRLQGIIVAVSAIAQNGQMGTGSAVSNTRNGRQFVAGQS